MSHSLLFFIFGALVMVIAPLLLLLHGFLRSHTEAADEQSRRRENIRHAKARLAALQAGEGDAALDEDARREQQDEIKAQLLADTRAQTEAEAEAQRSPAIVGGIALCAAFLLMAPVLYAFYGTPQALLPAASAPVAEGAAEGHAGSMAEVIAALRQRVEQQPQDGEGMVLLAASLMVMNQPGEAAAYYRRARKVLGDRPQLLIGLAEALMAGGGTPAETEQVLQEALRIAPDEPYLLWIAGNWAREQGDAEKALSLFQGMEMLIADPESLQVVQEAIAELEAAVAAGETEGAKSTASARIEVAVQLAPELATQVRARADDVVFVFARARTGPPMPLAVQRVRAGELPLRVTLDDTMAMAAGMSLSRFSDYEVVARISKSGNATAASGDLFGSAYAVAGDTVTVVIQQVVP